MSITRNSMPSNQDAGSPSSTFATAAPPAPRPHVSSTPKSKDEGMSTAEKVGFVVGGIMVFLCVIGIGLIATGAGIGPTRIPGLITALVGAGVLGISMFGLIGVGMCMAAADEYDD